MGKPITYVLMLVDESASMKSLEAAVRSGFNEYVESLRSDSDAKYRLTVALFGERYTEVAEDEKLKDVKLLNTINYRAAQGATALYDSIARLVLGFEKRHPMVGEDDSVLVVIQTDGQDNHSREHTADSIKEMFAARINAKWNTIFLGAGPDAWRQGHAIGAGSTFQTEATRSGTQSVYAGLSGTTRSYAKGGSIAVASAALADEVGPAK